MREQTVIDHAELLKCTVPAEPAFPPITRRILVPTDGSSTAGAAIRFAALLSERAGGSVAAATVLPALPVFAGEFTLDASAWEKDPALTSSLLDRVRRQVHGGGGADWQLHVEFGSPAAEIDALARKTGTTMIVIGLGSHHALSRVFGVETALRVIRHAAVPVLAVQRGTRRLPRTAIIAADLSGTDLAAARAALDVMQRPATLHLVHVRPELHLVPRIAPDWVDAYTDAVTGTLELLAARLRAPDVIVDVRVVAGEVAEEIVRTARSLRASLVAAGRRSSNPVERLLMGSSVTEMVRSAKCSVLVVPPVEPTL